METEHNRTFFKVETDDSSKHSSSQSTTSSHISMDEAARKALNKVKGTITEVEEENEHGRLEFKFETQSNRGEADVRVDAQTDEITRVKFEDDDNDDTDD